MKNNKKAELSTSKLVEYIIALTLAVVIIGISLKLLIPFSDNKIIEQCRASYLVSQVAKDASKDFFTGKIDCPVQQIKDVTSETIVKGLRDCWYKTLGMSNSIGRDMYPIPAGDILKADKSFCNVCAEFTPTKDISTQDVKDVINSETSKKDGNVLYSKFLENPNWQDPDRFFLTFLKSAVKNSIVDENILKDTTAVSKYNIFTKGKEYVILSQSYGENPSMFITPKEQQTNAPCLILQYQKEETTI